MGIALSLGNNLTTGGRFKASAVNNTSCNNITSFANIASNAGLVLIQTQTASATTNISFTTGFTSTYDMYIFKWISCHPSTDNVDWLVNFSTDGGSNYNVSKQTTFFAAYLTESDTSPTLTYATSNDLTNGTGYQMLNDGVGADNDQHTSGYLELYNPSSTTYVKQFIARSQRSYYLDYSIDDNVAGYANTTSAINAVDFKFESGNIDSGTISLYGVKKS